MRLLVCRLLAPLRATQPADIRKVEVSKVVSTKGLDVRRKRQVKANPLPTILLLLVLNAYICDVWAPASEPVRLESRHPSLTTETSKRQPDKPNPRIATTTKLEHSATSQIEAKADLNQSQDSNIKLISQAIKPSENQSRRQQEDDTRNVKRQDLSGQLETRESEVTQNDSNSKLSGHLRFEFQRYDGWYNNLANSDWGTPNSRLRRRVAPAYSDGVYQMADEGRPSARVLSQRMMRGEDGLASRRNLTTIFAFFGQLISSEILMASESGCPIEMHRIKIEKCDPMYDRDCRGGRTMPFYRSAYDPTTGQSPNLPREQINRVTSWIDGSFIYSTSETWLNTMRSFDGRGTLKMVSTPQVFKDASSPQQPQHLPLNSNGQLIQSLLEAAASAAGLTPKTSGLQKEPMKAEQMMASMPMSLFGYPVRNKLRAPLINHMPAHHLKMKTAERMFLLGDPRTNQNPIILALGILFYRWHNVLAERIYAEHPDWSDEEIFQRARRLVIASLQNIILYEYLPVLLDTPPPYGPHPGISLRQPLNSTFANPNHTQPIIDLTTDGGSLMPDSYYDQHDLIRSYSGYKPDLHPGISHVFQSAAFRFGHTLIPPGLYLRDHHCRFLDTPSGFKGVRLCSTWWNAEEVVSQVGIEQLLMGASSQIAEREDYVLCNDVRDKLFGPLDFSRRDLAALNIMRGRDNGLPDYNTVRQAFKLPKITEWSQINPNLYSQQPEIFDQLAQLYDFQIDKLDLYIGGMLESDSERGRPGPLFRRIIKEQLERLRDSDRFWFENVESGIFSKAEIEQIKKISLYDIIVNSTLIPDNSIQRQVFHFKPEDPCPQPGQLSSSQLQPCYIVKGHSYFKGNELPYALVCLALIMIPMVCSLVAHCLVNYQEKKRRQFKTKQEYQRNMRASDLKSSQKDSDSKTSASEKRNDQAKSDKFYAKEWLHSSLKRKIKIRFGPAPDENLYVLNRRCEVQRSLDLSQSSTIVVELSADCSQTQRLSPEPLQSASQSSLYPESRGSVASQVSLLSAGKLSNPRASEDQTNSTPCYQHFNPIELDQPTSHQPMILIRVERNYDLVLQFYDVQQRRRFLFRLQAYLHSVNKCLALFKVPRDVMLANAETKEKRQQRLEQFFREAYALTFSLNGDQQSDVGSVSSKVSPDVGLVMRTSLSRQEFAEALGMKSDSLFVKQMFNCVDKDGNGRISFQEFLNTVVMFSRGKPDDKLRIIFDMCDHGGQGVIEKAELIRILRSLVDIAKTKYLSEEQVMSSIEGMFTSAGFGDKQMLTYDDFKLIISNHQKQSAENSPPDAEQLNGPFEDNSKILAIGLDMKGAKKNFLIDTSATCAKAIQGQHLFDSQNKTVDGIPCDSPRSNSPTSPALLLGSKSNNTKDLVRPKNLLLNLKNRWRTYLTTLEQHGKDIVYLLSFFVIVMVLFCERFIQYSYLSEHMDLRHVMGFGIAITRGSAASLSFCYAMLLLTMCRNIMTRLRTTSIGDYLPLDSHVKLHKIIAMTALVMTVLHSIGHCVNFFHVTQQPVEHLRCLTKEMQFNGESRPTFTYWIFQTVTGSTGLLLWILCSILYVFAHPRVRQKAYRYFWSTHKLYYLIYAITLMHGSSKLTGSPKFWIFFIIPATLFAIDKIISLQTKLLELEIFETECLPSGKSEYS